MIDLSGKSAVVTGGSRGIGRAIALRLADPGRRRLLQLPRRTPPRPPRPPRQSRHSAARRSRSRPTSRSRSPRSRSSPRRWTRFGKVDILVNNAGITRDDLIMRMSLEAWTDVLQTNLFGAFYTIKAVTRPMLKARGGRIINITSVSGQAGQMGQANYSSAKAGLIGLTKATARELASRGITCNAVAPGFMLTELTSDAARGAPGTRSRARTPLGRFGTTEEIASAVAFLVSDEAAFITGQVLAVDGGLVMM